MDLLGHNKSDALVAICEERVQVDRMLRVGRTEKRKHTKGQAPLGLETGGEFETNQKSTSIVVNYYLILRRRVLLALFIKVKRIPTPPRSAPRSSPPTPPSLLAELTHAQHIL
ncbi:hypothetical protein QTP88_022563 [Uroleucon formosanum]